MVSRLNVVSVLQGRVPPNVMSKKTIGSPSPGLGTGIRSAIAKDWSVSFLDVNSQSSDPKFEGSALLGALQRLDRLFALFQILSRGSETLLYPTNNSQLPLQHG